ncbi:MAG TPA: ABC transporter ATP-binding protein, partial [Acidimicrobiales bacterium]|nr:ABC transporter ATP-binding protein [Acidimicrobiales bacterium]
MKDLVVSFPTPDGVVEAVRGVSFALDEGSTLGVVGESGSGKSVAAQTMIGLTRGALVSGSALFEGRDLLEMSREELKAVRGPKIAMVFQDPLSSLHPYYKIGWQIAEAIRAHEKVGKAAARRRAVELLGMVGIPHPERRVDDYPFQFSGGMRQRAMIAIALSLNPSLLIADEPTTALDVTVQAQVLELMMRLQAELGMAIIVITHDLGIIAGMADQVMIMYGGQVMETASRRDMYYSPHHPYTSGLLESLPQSGHEGERLLPIQGQPPSLIGPPSGCPFWPRCGFAMPRCRAETPPLRPIAGPGDHRSACWLPLDLLGHSVLVDAARHLASVVESSAV